MNTEADISLADLTREMRKEKGLLESSEDDFSRLIREKYTYLFNNVILRSKLDYRFKGKHMIPLRDKTIVKALLIRAAGYGPDPDKDSIYVEWFNGNIKENDYETIARLGLMVDNLISNELCYDDWDIDDVTRNEWIAAIHSSIKLSLALNILNATEALQDMNEQLAILDHGIPFGDMIKGNPYGSRIYLWKGLFPQIDTSKPLADALHRCFSLDDYTMILRELIHLIIIDAHEKSVDFIKAYAELKRSSGYHSADQLLSTDSLASEYTAFFQNIYEFLNQHPEMTRLIEEEIGTDNLLAFFKMRDRNPKASSPKKSAPQKKLAP